MFEVSMDQLPQQASLQGNPVVRWICNVMIAISAVGLGVMMFLSVASITGRFFFLRPIEGTEELVGMLLIVCASLGLGYCQLMKGNISIDIFTSRLKPRGQAGVNIVSYLMSFVVSVVISWRGFLLMHQYMVEKLGSISAILGILLWPFMLIMSLSFAWVAVIFLFDIYYSFRMVLRK
jgi:TRAP-type C4-dicarboxylate transport system permease small subunit